MPGFSLRGGIHPPNHKTATADRPIRPLPLPPRLYLPLKQHIGAAAEPIVAVGDRVTTGQPLAQPGGRISAPIHAPTSGWIQAIAPHPAVHASGLERLTLTLEPDGQDEWHPVDPPHPRPLTQSPADLAAQVADAGIVGLGGAAFPSAVKLDLGQRGSLHTLVINGAECEPYLTADDRLMREHTRAIIDGVRVMATALGVERTLVAVEANKPEARRALRRALRRVPEIRLVRLPNRYPMGSEKHLVQALTGRETPAGRLTSNIGVVVHNVATAYAVYEAVFQGRPLTHRVVTVSGAAMTTPSNWWVPLGTPLDYLVAQSDGLRTAAARWVGGGPMMGQPVQDLRAPVIKGTNGLLALTAAEVGHETPGPCIRCGQCVAACPCGLLPLEIAARVRQQDWDGAVAAGLQDCIGCGSCTYVCPAHRPLNQHFAHARGQLAARDRAERKRERTRRLAEARQRRQAAQRAAVEDKGPA